MLSNLGWRSLENRRIDTCLAIFYKIVYGPVAVLLPSYFEHPEVYTLEVASSKGLGGDTFTRNMTDGLTHGRTIILLS